MCGGSGAWMVLGLLMLTALARGADQAAVVERYHRASTIGERGYGQTEPRPTAPPQFKTYPGRPRIDFTPDQPVLFTEDQPRLSSRSNLTALLAAFRRAATPLAEARRRRLQGTPTTDVLTKALVGRALFGGMGVTKVERFGGRVFTFRSAASAGALYPVELYLAANAVSDLEAGLYHYDVLHHRLEQVRPGGETSARVRAALATDEQTRQPAAYVILTGVFDRTRAKYNVRGYRYVLLDVGHVAENLALEAAGLGLGVRLLPHFDDDGLNGALGVDGEQEASLLVVALETTETGESHVAPPSRADEPVRGPGRATTLSAQVHQVTRLDADTLAAVVAAAPAAGPEPTADAELTALGEPTEPGGTLEEALCARRSRRRYGRGGLSAGQLATVLEWTAGGVATRGLRFYVVVKQVEGVAAGVYRYWPGRRSLEQTAPPPSGNELAEAVVGQSWVAEAGCVVVLVAEAGELRGPLGARWYRTVHLGGGQAGERVYLAAEGVGLGTCAVGAFRDDAVAGILGLEEGVWPLLLYPVGR